jgi:hypothetical protein
MFKCLFKLFKKPFKKAWWDELIEETEYEKNKIHFNEVVMKEYYNNEL